MSEPVPAATAVVVREGRILMGLRLKQYGHGQWQLPGGSIEEGESIEEAAARELFEETRLIATGPQILGSQIITPAGSPITYRTWFVGFSHVAGEPHNTEPHKCAQWAWVDPRDVPGTIFEIDPEHMELLATFADHLYP